MDESGMDLCVINPSWAESNGSAILDEMRSRFPDAFWILLGDDPDWNGKLPAELEIHGVIDKPLTLEALRGCLSRIFPPSPTSYPEIVLNSDDNSVHFDGRLILLTPIEFRILSELWNARGTLIRRDEICSKLWGTTRVPEHTFDTHFTNMKRKIPELRNRIQVFRSRGYILLP